MTLLFAGVLTWSVAHLFAATPGPARANLVARLGPGAFKGLTALVVLAGLVMIVVGWRSADFIEIWSPPRFMTHITALLMIPAFVLVLCPYLPNNIRRRMRHPMLVGVKIWAVAHLLANGDLASIILFGGLLLWAGAQVAVLNRRDGVWTPPPPVSGPMQYAAIAAGLIAYPIFALALHAWLIGVAPFG